MTADGATPGRCPNCETQIPATRALIEYETAAGTRVYSECPACLDVVHPT